MILLANAAPWGLCRDRSDPREQRFLRRERNRYDDSRPPLLSDSVSWRSKGRLKNIHSTAVQYFSGVRDQTLGNASWQAGEVTPTTSHRGPLGDWRNRLPIAADVEPHSSRPDRFNSSLFTFKFSRGPVFFV
jgi:hypothetical protein